MSRSSNVVELIDRRRELGSECGIERARERTVAMIWFHSATSRLAAIVITRVVSGIREAISHASVPPPL